MIKLVRVDYRLLHGQVAFSWTSHLGSDCILLVTNTLLNDPARVTAVKLAKPSGVKVVVKNLEESIEAVKKGITDKYNLFVVCETIDEAVGFIDALDIKELNLGGTKPGEGKKELAPVVYVTAQEEEKLSALKAKGVNVFSQMIPESKVKKF